jgi:hypothetical protein
MTGFPKSYTLDVTLTSSTQRLTAQRTVAQASVMAVASIQALQAHPPGCL